MARNVTEESLCDYCGEAAVKTFTVSEAARVSVVDVCDKDAEPFETALTKGSAEPRRRAAGSTPPRPEVHRVIPVD